MKNTRAIAIWFGALLLAGPPAKLLVAAGDQPPQALLDKLQDSWVLRLPEEESWKNGQYRYRLFSFWQRQGQMHYLDFSVYPQAGIRSQLLVGTAVLHGKELYLTPQKGRSIANKGSGFPTPFQVEELGEEELQGFGGSREIALDGQKLQLDGQDFSSYRQQWGRAVQQGNALLAMDLLMLNQYLLHNQLQYFGSTDMTKYRDSRLPGLIGGFVLLDFEMRGLLGLGNSGLNFEFVGFEQLHRVKLHGKIFGGAMSMGEVLNVALDGTEVLRVDFSHVQVHNGYANGGYYLVKLAGRAEQQIAVGPYGQ